MEKYVSVPRGMDVHDYFSTGEPTFYPLDSFPGKLLSTNSKKMQLDEINCNSEEQLEMKITFSRTNEKNKLNLNDLFRVEQLEEEIKMLNAKVEKLHSEKIELAAKLTYASPSICKHCKQCRVKVKELFTCFICCENYCSRVFGLGCCGGTVCATCFEKHKENKKGKIACPRCGKKGIKKRIYRSVLVEKLSKIFENNDFMVKGKFI